MKKDCAHLEVCGCAQSFSAGTYINRIQQEVWRNHEVKLKSEDQDKKQHGFFCSL